LEQIHVVHLPREDLTVVAEPADSFVRRLAGYTGLEVEEKLREAERPPDVADKLQAVVAAEDMLQVGLDIGYEGHKEAGHLLPFAFVVGCRTELGAL
jgi:hypothetical protein